ncbi:MAG: tail fiber domain-containing protein [Candidatus Jorgensenbacteria bacterium]|nr:tail fiber domain-containing protein [Candidatus Jorgensenbacteria bacterium]
MGEKNKRVIFIVLAVTLFLGTVSLTAAINVGSDLDFDGVYRILNASTTTILGSLSVGTTTSQGAGTIYALNGIKFFDGTTQTSAVSGSVATTTSAGNVSTGVFGSVVGKGNYTFQGAASANTVLFVDATNERIGIGTNAPAYKLDVQSGVRLGSSTEVMRISSAGLVGIGTTNPATPLHIVGTSTISNGNMRIASSSYGIVFSDNTIQTTAAANVSNHWTLSGSNLYASSTSYSVGIGNTNPGSYKLAVTGNVQATAFYYSSDVRMKENIKPLQNSLQKIMQLQGVSFEWKKDGSGSIGLIAQDTQKVFPELVSTDEATGVMSLQYANLVAPLIEAVKEQQKQINKLKIELEALRKKIR